MPAGAFWVREERPGDEEKLWETRARGRVGRGRTEELYEVLASGAS